MSDGYVYSNIVKPKKKPSYITLKGNGYLGGDFPDAVTKVEGVPSETEILVFLRRDIGLPGDGLLVAHIKTHVSGSWRVANLNPNLRYDVICRAGTYNDQIMSNVKPFVE